MFLNKKEREKYFNSDGTVKRLLEVVEILSDGTRIFENGRKAYPSKVDFKGEKGFMRLDSMTETEHIEWETDPMTKVGKAMSEYYQAISTGAVECLRIDN